MAERRRRNRPAPRPPFAETPAPDAESNRVGRMKTRVEEARVLRDEWMQTYKIDQLGIEFLGTTLSALSDGDDRTININRFWPTLRAQLPSLFFQNPTFFVDPIAKRGAPQDLQLAAMGEAILKAIAMQDFHFRGAVRLALLQAFFQIGVLKVVYDPQTIRNPDAGAARYLTDPDGFPVRDEVGDPVLEQDEDGNPVVEPDEIVSDETYRWEWVNASNMLLPDDGPDMSKWSWIGEEITVDLDDAKEDPQFPASLRRQFKANASRKGDRDALRVSHAAEDEKDQFTYVEIWHKKDRKRYVIAEGQDFSDEFLVEEDLPEGVEDHPYAILPGWTPIILPEPSPWPLPHVYNWLDLQQEYNIRRRQMMEGAKRSARKVGYDQGTFANPDDAVKALQSPVDMEAVELTSTQQPWIVLQDAPVPPSIAQDAAYIDADWIRTTGLSGSRLGSSPSDTATEAVLENQAGNIRDVDMREDVMIWLARAGKKMLQRVQATLTLGMYVKMRGLKDSEFQGYLAQVYGPEIPQQLQLNPGLRAALLERIGEDRWVEITREDLEFESVVSVVPGSAKARSIESEKRQLLEFLGLLGRFPQLALSRELLRILGNSFEFISESLMDELNVLAQRMVEINARQAGRLQGNEGPAQGGANGATGGLQAAMLQRGVG